MPTFYERDGEGLPRAWLALVRASLSKLTPRFSANRMMREYVTTIYDPAARELARRLADGAAAGRALEAWRRRLLDGWAGIRVGALSIAEERGCRSVSLEVFLGEIPPEDLAVELFADAPDGRSAPERRPMTPSGPLPGTTHGHLFTATVPASRPAAAYTARVVPARADALWPLELPLVAWRE